MKSLFSVLLLLVSITVAAQKLRIGADERIEFLTIIQYLSDYPILNQNDSLRYKEEVEHYFGRFRNHEAVVLHRKIYRRMFGFDAPITYMLHHDIPRFRQIAPFSETDRKSYEFDVNKDTLTILMQAFRDFYRKSDFGRFFRAHRTFYDSLSNQVAGVLSTYDVISTMEQHYGQRFPSYKVVLSPLLNDGGYAVDVAAQSGHIFYAVTGPISDTAGSLPRFGAQILLSELILHEFSHNFCNPLIDHYWDSLQQYSCLLKPIAASLKEQGYSSWKSCLYEHLVRANEIVLNERLFGKRRADELYHDFIDNGSWIYLKGLLPIIRNTYSQHRKTYPALGLVMPQIVAYFRAESRQCR